MTTWEHNENGVLGLHVYRSYFTFVPYICTLCRHYSPGERGELGSWLSGPCCYKGLWAPTKKGACRLHESRKAFRYYPPKDGTARLLARRQRNRKRWER